jgi:hypothetical protein
VGKQQDGGRLREDGRAREEGRGRRYAKMTEDRHNEVAERK